MPKLMEHSRHPYGPAYARLIDRLAQLPGIGRKSAERMAYHLLNCDPVRDAGTRRGPAVYPRGGPPMPAMLQSDRRRFVRHLPRSAAGQAVDLHCRAAERSDRLGGGRRLFRVVSCAARPDFAAGRRRPGADLTIDALVRRVRSNGVKEIVMATNPTLEGDGTALYISNLLEEEAVKITRLARGIASGSVLEFANGRCWRTPCAAGRRF